MICNDYYCHDVCCLYANPSYAQNLLISFIIAFINVGVFYIIIKKILIPAFTKYVFDEDDGSIKDILHISFNNCGFWYFFGIFFLYWLCIMIAMMFVDSYLLFVIIFTNVLLIISIFIRIVVVNFVNDQVVFAQLKLIFDFEKGDTECELEQKNVIYGVVECMLKWLSIKSYAKGYIETLWIVHGISMFLMLTILCMHYFICYGLILYFEDDEMVAYDFNPNYYHGILMDKYGELKFLVKIDGNVCRSKKGIYIEFVVSNIKDEYQISYKLLSNDKVIDDVIELEKMEK